MKTICVMMCVLLASVCVGQRSAAELQPLTIQLNWIPNVQFAGILWAKEQGWYAEAGIELTVKGWEFGISSVDEIVADRAQIGVVEGDALIKANVSGNAIKAIGVQFQKTPFCLLSKKKLGIETPESLVGKRVGVNSPESVIMTKIVLASQGLRYEDIIPVQAGWELAPLINDEIDVFAAFMNHDPLIMKAEGYEVTYLPAFKYGYDFYSGVYAVTEVLMREQPEGIRTFLAVTLRGWQAAFQDPAAAARLVVEKYYPDGSVAQQTESLKMFRMLATLGEGKKFLGWMEEDFWAKGIDLLSDFQQIDKKVPAQEVFTMEFLNAIYFGKEQ